MRTLESITAGELPGNHVLARMSHEATLRSLQPGHAEASKYDVVEEESIEVIAIRETCRPQDCVDEASIESFPASDPPAYIQSHA